MLASLRLVSVLGLAVALAAACDRTPTAPEMDDVAGLLSISNTPAFVNSRAFNNTLPALFREAIAKVNAAQGRERVDVLLADWRGLQEKLKAEAPTASRPAVQARLAAIHDEELRIVERVLGEDITARIISEASVALQDARVQMSAASVSGDNIQSAAGVAADAAQKIEAARLALANSRSREALEAASQAATLVAGLQYFLIETRRVHGLETLFPQAVQKLSAQGVHDPAIAELETLNARTRAALDAGNRTIAQSLLEQVRAAQIRMVLRALGTPAATRLVEQVDARAGELATRVAEARTSGQNGIKVERMLHEAQDMNARARAALRKGDAAAALDLGSHAAGLLNAVQHLTWH